MHLGVFQIFVHTVLWDLRCVARGTWTSQDPMGCVFRLQPTTAWSPRTSVSCTPVDPRGFHGPLRAVCWAVRRSASQSDNRKLSLAASTATAQI